MNVDIGEKELKIFADAIGNYFEQISGEGAEIRAAYLADAENLPPVHDFTGCISIGGRYCGKVYFSAPRTMLRHLLMKMREPEQTDENFLDAVGEIANTVAGNARKFYGAEMEISVPVTLAAFPDTWKRTTRSRPFVIRLYWKRYGAVLVVDLARREA